MEWLTTSTILRDLRDFDRPHGWNVFVERFRRPIISFARKLGHSAEDAEDVAQATLVAFAEAYRGGCYDREKGRLSHWLFGIAYRHAMKEHARSARRRAAMPPGSDGDSVLASIPDSTRATRLWDREWEVALLEECLARVRHEVEPTTMRAFELTALENRPATHVAKELGIAVTAVYNGKHRVVKRLRELREHLEQVE